MSDNRIQHDTIVMTHDFPVPPSRVFRAWSDACERRLWDVPGADAVIVEHRQSFEVGGTEVTKFGPAGNPLFYSEGTFKEILPDRRVIETGSFRVNDEIVAASVVTLEFDGTDAGTTFTLTDQSVFVNQEDGAADRRQGWKEIMVKLADHLAADAA